MLYEEILWSAQSSYPLLAFLQLVPLLLAACMVALRGSPLLFPVGVLGAVAELFLAIYLYSSFDQSNAALQFAERFNLLGAFNYHAAADGITILFVLLTALLTFIVIIYGRVRPLEPTWRFQALVFAVEGALMSQFVTVDILWFTLVSFFQLVLVGYLLSDWATSPDKDIALKRYLQFMTIGILLLLTGAILLGWNHADVTNGVWSFNLYDLAKVPIQAGYQSVIFFVVFYGLAIRIPLFPLHGWLPLIAEHGTVAVAPVYLLGVKTGVYGLLRFVFPLMQEAVIQWHEYVIAFALAGIFYAALLALIQVNMRRLLAYAVVSHTGVMIISLFSLSYIAFQGGIMLAINFSLAIAGLLFMTGLVFRRTHSMLISRLGGLFDHLPLIGIAFLLAGLSIIGMPGTPGFDALHLMLEAVIEGSGAVVAITAALGNVIAAGFLLWAFQRAFLAPCPYGPLTVEKARRSERFIAIIIIVVLLGSDFYFDSWLELIDKPLEALGALYGHPANIPVKELPLQ